MIRERREKMLDTIEKEFALPGYRDYIDCHFGHALEVVRNGGNIYDLDNIVNLEGILQCYVSYDLYHYIDDRCEELEVNVGELVKEDYEILMDMCRNYMEGGRKYD